MDTKKEDSALTTKCDSTKTADEVHTSDLKRAVEVLADDEAPEHHKKAADSLIEQTAKDAKKAENFTPKKPDVAAGTK